MRLRLVVLLSLAVAWQASASLQLTLRLGSPTTVPGLTRGIWLDVRNNGTAPAQIPRFAALQVRTESGAEFIVPGGDPGYHEFVDNPPGPYLAFQFPILGRSPVLQPDETMTFLLHEGYGSPWMCDSRLETPGAYRLRVVADERISGARLASLSRVLDQEGLAGPVVSNEVTLTVREPQGDDAAVWGMRIDRGVGVCRWTFIGREDQILEQYPRSAYVQFLYPQDFRRKPEVARIQHLERSIAVDPEHPIAETRRVELAQIYVQRAYDEARAAQLQQALVDLEKGRELLLGVLRRRVNPYAQQQAVSGMPASREDFIASYKRMHAPARLELVLDCIEPLAGGRFNAWLYYHNTTPENLHIPLGENNKITPSPFDRGQPQVFARGTDWYFKVTSDGADLMWHIDGTDLKISAKKLAEPPDPDGGWESWSEDTDRERRKAIHRCSPGFAPDPEKLHTAAFTQGGE
jgi:hypothetical protein